jgi:hypothetical protein
VSDTPLSAQSRPWGYKLISYMYFEGEPSNDIINSVCDTLNNVTPTAVFHGMAVEDVQEKPYDQGGS